MLDTKEGCRAHAMRWQLHDSTIAVLFQRGIELRIKNDTEFTHVDHACSRSLRSSTATAHDMLHGIGIVQKSRLWSVVSRHN